MFAHGAEELRPAATKYAARVSNDRLALRHVQATGIAEQPDLRCDWDGFEGDFLAEVWFYDPAEEYGGE
eukprot:4017193-Karenia_brevis.AAC.1